MRATAHQQIGTIAMLRGERSGSPKQCQFSRECLLSVVVQSNLAASASKTAALSSFRTREPKQTFGEGLRPCLTRSPDRLCPGRAAITWIERLRPTSDIAHEH